MIPDLPELWAGGSTGEETQHNKNSQRSTFSFVPAGWAQIPQNVFLCRAPNALIHHLHQSVSATHLNAYDGESKSSSETYF